MWFGRLPVAGNRSTRYSNPGSWKIEVNGILVDDGQKKEILLFKPFLTFFWLSSGFFSLSSIKFYRLCSSALHSKALVFVLRTVLTVEGPKAITVLKVKSKTMYANHLSRDIYARFPLYLLYGALCAFI